MIDLRPERIINQFKSTPKEFLFMRPSIVRTCAVFQNDSIYEIIHNISYRKQVHIDSDLFQATSTL